MTSENEHHEPARTEPAGTIEHLIEMFEKVPQVSVIPVDSMDRIVSYVTESEYALPKEEPLPTHQVNDSTFERNLYEHLEGIKPIQLDERPKLLMLRSLHPALALLYEKIYKYLYDATKINMAEEVRLS